MGEKCKKFLRANFFNLLLILSVIAIIYFFYNYIKLLDVKINEDQKKIVRDFSYTNLKFFDEEPKDREVEWNQEIPIFLKQDMKKARKYRYDIEYYFFGNRLTFRYCSGQWKLETKSAEETELYRTREYLNFSLYKDVGNNIVVYGYPTIAKQTFVKFVLGDAIYEEELLTHDSNLSFDKDQNKSSTPIRVEGFTLLKEGETFNFYLNGKQISSQLFAGCGSNSEIKDSFILVDNKLYMLYYNLYNGKPLVKFVKVSNSVESIEEKRQLYSANVADIRTMSMPIFIKEG